MPKQTNYPRKFRQKRERVAIARDGRREWPDDDHSIGPDKIDVHQTFYRSFLPAKSVQAMICRIDEVLERICITTHFRPTAPNAAIQLSGRPSLP
jgi:hypothetical protein